MDDCVLSPLRTNCSQIEVREKMLGNGANVAAVLLLLRHTASRHHGLVKNGESA